MHARAGYFANRVQASPGRATKSIRHHTAHAIMGGWRYRDQVACQVKSILAADGRNGGETRIHAVSGKMAQVEILAIDALGQHLAENGAGNNIAWCKLGQLMIPGHETLSPVLAQVSSLPPPPPCTPPLPPITCHH